MAYKCCQMAVWHTSLVRISLSLGANSVKCEIKLECWSACVGLNWVAGARESNWGTQQAMAGSAGSSDSRQLWCETLSPLGTPPPPAFWRAAHPNASPENISKSASSLPRLRRWPLQIPQGCLGQREFCVYGWGGGVEIHSGEFEGNFQVVGMQT